MKKANTIMNIQFMVIKIYFSVIYLSYVYHYRTLFLLQNASMSYISSVMEVDETQHIHLPFLLLTCGSNCEIECSVSSDAKDYQLRFSEPFKIMEDTEVLRHIPLVQSLDRGPFDLDHINRAMKQLPDFMQGRFVGLLQASLMQINRPIIYFAVIQQGSCAAHCFVFNVWLHMFLALNG